MLKKVIISNPKIALAVRMSFATVSGIIIGFMIGIVHITNMFIEFLK